MDISYPLYRKEQRGKSFRYVEDRHDFGRNLDHLPVGAHLIVVKGDGWKSYCQNIEPDHAAVLASLSLLRDAMVDAMKELNKYSVEPVGKPLTKKQREALDEYQRLRGDTLTVFKGVCMWDVVEAGIKCLESKLLPKE